MNCVQARRLFSAAWDDESTQAERDVLEAHLAGCTKCRAEYDGYSRTLEIAARMPRVEPLPEFAERVLARVRRQSSAPDHVPQRSVRWLPLTAAASVLAIAGLLAAPWLGLGPDDRVARLERVGGAGTTPGPVTPAEVRVSDPVPPSKAAPSAEAPLAAAAEVDSLFDHSEDVEFILDPVSLRRGRASVAHPPATFQAEQAIISF